MESFYYKPVLFRVQERFLSIAGLWIPTYYSKKKLFLICYTFFLIFYVEIIFNISEYIIFPSIYKDVDKLIEHVGMLLQHLVGSVKVFNHLYHLKKIQSIMHRLDDDEFKYESLDDFKPNDILKKYITIGNYFTVIWFMVGNGVPLSKIVPKINDIFGTNHLNNDTIVCSDLLPYYSWFPFDIDTVLSCRIAYIIQLFPMIIYGWQISST